ncbi:MAG: SurA N-terminal domain-containing protein [Opitutaceae bacterium]
MISWIQNHLIRHGRWIFLSLLALIIVAFVFTIGNTPGCTSDQSAYQEQRFYGIDLNSPLESKAIAEKAQLSAYLNGQQIRTEAQYQSMVINRIAKLHLADEIGLPTPTQSALAEYIKTKQAFAGPDGQFSPDAYTSFVDGVDTNPQAQSGLVGLVLEEDYRIDQLNSVIAGPGFILPSEAIAQAQTSQTTLKLSTAELAYKDYEPTIGTDDGALQSHFEANGARYEIPERIKASYVVFPASQYTEQVAEATDAELREHFIANRAKFVDAHKATLPAPAEGEEAPAVTFEDVRDAVATSLSSEEAIRIANQAAQAFALKLYNSEIERDSAAFNQLVNESNLTLIPIEPYTADGAAQRGLSREMLESAFKLNDDRYYSDPYPVSGAFAVLIYQDRIDPEMPSFESVKDEVIANYKAEQKRDLFNAEGERLKAELEAKVAEGTSFADAAAALDLKANSYDTFKVAEAPRTLNRTLLQTAQGLEAGTISPMITANEIGSFVYLETKEVPEIAEDNEDYTQSAQFLKYLSSSVSGSSFTNELVSIGLPEDDAESETGE